MPYYINGYFMAFHEARKIGRQLGIDVGEDNNLYHNIHLEMVINDWLANNNKLETKSALIGWPRGSEIAGIVFISHFRHWEPPREDPDEPHEEDLKIKAWLESFGVKGLQWVSTWDEGGSITLNGTQPCRSYPDGMGPVPISFYGGPAPAQTKPSE
ncbi:hypothetical protein BJ912DRAFT_1148139 [Pholiota molesta]|nr:hypothetical protein BJ912DRAFT_1148139 [Pholiota molesta]